MTLSVAVSDIFTDAQAVHAQALERLEAGDIRDAAEKAWCAVKRATDALILARTGNEPRSSGQTTRGIRSLCFDERLVAEKPAFDSLRTRYGSYMSFLHGACFYDGICEPEADVRSDIHRTAQYILDAMALAGLR
jgi:hypothetical protein